MLSFINGLKFSFDTFSKKIPCCVADIKKSLTFEAHNSKIEHNE